MICRLHSAFKGTIREVNRISFVRNIFYYDFVKI